MKRKVLLGLLIMAMCCCAACGKSNGTQSNSNELQNSNTGVSDDSNTSNENASNSTILSMEVLEQAEASNKEDFVYFTYEDETYITEYIGVSEIVVIPEEIDGTPVVEISNTAFRNNETVRAVRIGNNVKVIGEGVFANCSMLEYVIFGNSVEGVGKSAFIGCANMKELRLNEGLVSVGELAICGAEIPIIIPRSVTEIGLNAFTQPVQVYSGSYAEEYIIEYAENYGAEFIYEIIE